MTEPISIADVWQDIVDFHVRFGLEYKGPPRPLEEELSQFRQKFMQEELNEYGEAVANGDREKQFDALIDLVYVAVGTAYMHGFHFPEGWRRVQAANMAKIRGTKESSTRGSSYDVIKPAGWTPPTLTDLV